MNIPKYELKYRNRTFLADSKEAMFANIDKYFSNKNIQYDKQECKSHIDKNIKVNSAFSGEDVQSKRLNRKYIRQLSFKDVVSGAKALLGASLGNVVDQTEITRRGRICAGCPHNTKTTDCYGCGFAGTLNKFINNLKGIFGKEVSLNPDVKGHYCNICGCALSIMIPSKLSAFHEDEDKQNARPDFCWLKKDSENYKES